MLEIVRVLDLPGTASAVWKRFGAFEAIGSWHPAVASIDMALANGRERRRLILTDGAVLIEDRIDDGSDPHAYEYRIVESPLPVINYSARFSIVARGEGSRITWRGRFDASGVEDEDAKAMVAGIYEAGLDAIAGEVTHGR